MKRKCTLFVLLPKFVYALEFTRHSECLTENCLDCRPSSVIGSKESRNPMPSNLHHSPPRAGGREQAGLDPPPKSFTSMSVLPLPRSVALLGHPRPTMASVDIPKVVPSLGDIPKSTHLGPVLQGLLMLGLFWFGFVWFSFLSFFFPD